MGDLRFNLTESESVRIPVKGISQADKGIRGQCKMEVSQNRNSMRSLLVYLQRSTVVMEQMADVVRCR